MKYKTGNLEMKTLFAFVIILLFAFTFVLTSISHAGKIVDPTKEFIIADSSSLPLGVGNISIYGDIVTWRGGGICYKDLRTGEQYQISFSGFDSSPSVYEDTIVWANHDSIGGNDGIYTHDISTGITTRVVSNPPDANPTNAKIYGNTIVWHGNGGSPILLSGLDLSTGEVFEIFSDYWLYGVDIYENTVVWGSSDSIWAKDLMTGEVLGPIDPSHREMGDSWWPFGVQFYNDLVVWKSQFIDDSGELKTWGVFGAYLSDGELLTISADPSYYSDTLNTDTNGKIVLWTKYYAGVDFQIIWTDKT